MKKCEGCLQNEESLLNLKKLCDSRHEEVGLKIGSIEQFKTKAEQTFVDIKTQLKRVSTEFSNHTEKESKHHENVIIHMTKTNEILAHLATKEQVAETTSTQDGKIRTMWIVGSLVGAFQIAVIGLLVWYIKVDINEHITKSSIINYKGTVKVVEKQRAENKDGS